MSADLVPSQTSVPDWLMTYCRQLADVHYNRRLNRMYVHMLQVFLKFEPWKANPPFGWKLTRQHYSANFKRHGGTDLGWIPMNMQIPTPMADQIKATIEAININDTSLKRAISMRTFLYTAVCWWCMEVHPYSGPGILGAD
jgi:hypothetical protein